MKKKGWIAGLSFFGFTAFLAVGFSFGHSQLSLNRKYETSASVSSEEKSEESDSDTNLLAGLFTGTGLVAVGGAGALVVGVNNRRRKENTPVKEIKNEDAD